MLQSTKTRALFGLGYVLLVFLASFSMADFMQSFLRSITLGEDVCNNAPDCYLYGYLTVARLTFALTIYHLSLFLLVLGVNTSLHPRAAFQNKYWGLKFLVLVGLVIGFWFIPNQFYLGWSYFALAGAFLFAIFQFFILIGFADFINQKFRDMIDESGTVGMMIVLLGITMIIYGLALALLSLLYKYFGGDGCGLNIFFTTFTLVVSAIATILSLLPAVQDRKHNVGLFQSSVIAGYSSYLTWIAVTGQPPSTFQCDTLGDDYVSRLIGLIPGSIFLFFAMFSWLAQNPKSSSSLEDAPLLQSAKDITAATSPSPTTESTNATQSPVDSSMASEPDENNDEIKGTVYSYPIFHLVLAVASLYLAMIITNWGILVQAPEGNYELSAGLPEMWLKWLAGAICLLLYIWTLIAPILFPDREFQ